MARILESGYPLNNWQRMLLAGWSLFLIAGFWFSSTLEPNPQGYGTHQQLGFPPCTFDALWGIPCPSCGGTTCFAHFVRGELIQALSVNPAAFTLAVICSLMIPWSWHSIWKKRLTAVEQPAMTLLLLLIFLCGLALLHWSWRLTMI